MPDRQDLYKNTLHRAAGALGADTLAARLAVSRPMLLVWLDGLGPIPEAAFLKAVDLLQEDELRKALQPPKT
ncbi:MAG TPA: hypothetical protein VHL85_10320 [Burkholderiales bacterium]|nr:hypothetical protein [Burkholderiales bacterium]